MALYDAGLDSFYCKADAMPLTELMNYFNDQLQTQARLRELPKTGFYKADNQYWARFGNLILGSQFAEI